MVAILDGKPVVFGDKEVTEKFIQLNEEAREKEKMRNDKEARTKRIDYLQDQVLCCEEDIYDARRMIERLEKEIKELQNID